MWARYHIGGDVEDDIVDGSNGNVTVLGVLKEDALDVICNLDEGEMQDLISGEATPLPLSTDTRGERV